MSHQAIYRKYRPIIFDDVLGQEHITKTIKNQIITNNIAHAYLFNGIRGTGKTSTAKIFSRAVNCLNNKDGNPCNECEICKSILQETNLDVIEMDAASNNSVEDIRDLRDKVKFMPSRSKYKVYIIDEVHMLSKGAFNALLKTLEEPPEHLLFILATTEPHKIPPTILSRCQRFDLKRITVNDIVSNMKKICNEMNVEIEDKALRLIAGNSDGAMRDALSILDRCITFGYDKINYEMVTDLLGTVSYENIINITDQLISKDIQNIMNHIDNIISNGKDIILFIEDLIVHFRNLLIIKTTNSNNNLVNKLDEVVEIMKKQSDLLDTDEIIMYIEKLSEVQLECKRALNPRVLFEAKLIRMIETKKDNSNIYNIIKRIEQLEKRINDNHVNINHSNNKHREPNKSTTNNKSDYKPKIETNKIINKNTESKQSNKNKIETINLTNGNQIDQIRNQWNKILNSIKNEKISLYAILRECKPISIEDNTIIFEFDSKFKFHLAAAEKESNKNDFKRILNKCLDTNYEIKFIQENNDTKVVQDNNIAEKMEKKVIDMFGEDIVEIE